MLSVELRAAVGTYVPSRDPLAPVVSYVYVYVVTAENTGSQRNGRGSNANEQRRREFPNGISVARMKASEASF